MKKLVDLSEPINFHLAPFDYKHNWIKTSQSLINTANISPRSTNFFL